MIIRNLQKTFSCRSLVILLWVVILLPAPLCADDLQGHFDPSRDLYLAQFDSKTDVDDVHSVAGVATMLRHPDLAGIKYHAVAGAYGIQEGLYVPSPELFALAFGDQWSDAHTDHRRAVEEVAQLATETLLAGGQVWVSDAGQSDFTADWLRRVVETHPAVDTAKLVHVVQHSDWNESVTSPDKLAYVQQHTEYHKIADGNYSGNGTPGLNTRSDALWDQVLQSENVGELWAIARSIGNEYNGKENRYLNESIAAGGLDFSDVSEACWIFGFVDLMDATEFFEEFLGSE